VGSRREHTESAQNMTVSYMFYPLLQCSHYHFFSCNVWQSPFWCVPESLSLSLTHSMIFQIPIPIPSLVCYSSGGGANCSGTQWQWRRAPSPGTTHGATSVAGGVGMGPPPNGEGQRGCVTTHDNDWPFRIFLFLFRTSLSLPRFL
jgi:hypothetical protein